MEPYANPIPESMERFEEAWSKANPDKLPAYCHNVYHLISEDMDGNVTNEMFAVNCMTNYGFSNIYKSANSSTLYMYIGEGDWIPDTASQSLNKPIVTTSATTVDGGISLASQRYYKDRDVLVVRSRIFTGYFNYNIGSPTITEDKNITEIGIGTSTTACWFIARVYDNNGQPSHFVKRPNERLTIKVYITANIKIADIVNKAWDKGLFLLVKPYSLLREKYSNYEKLPVVCYDADHNSCYSRGSSAIRVFRSDTTTISDGVATSKTTNVGSRYIEGKYDYVSEVNVNNGTDEYNNYPSYRYYNAYLQMFFKPKLDTPETIETDELYTNSYSSASLTNMFGVYCDYHDRRSNGNLPVVDIDIKSMKMYSCQDHDWTIDEDFVNNPDADYSCKYLTHSMSDYGYVEHLKAYSWYRVYVNTNTDAPIKSFGGTGYTLYATDSYWDSSTWEIIPNLSLVPEKLRNKRYYCTLTDQFSYSSTFPDHNYGNSGMYNTLITTREQTTHKIKTKTEVKGHTYPWSQTHHRSRANGIGKTITNDEYGYVVSMDWLVYPESENPSEISETVADQKLPYRYRIYGYNNDIVHSCLLWNTNKGDKIVAGGVDTWNAGLRLYTSISKDPETPPNEYTDFPFDAKFSANPHWSFSDNGFVVTSYISGANNTNHTYVLDMYGDDGTHPKMVKYEGYHHAHAIDLSNYFVGINANVSSHLSLDVVDMRTGDVYDIINLPEGYTFQGMCGWKNWVYIRVEFAKAYSTYLYYINEKTTTSLAINYPIMTIDGSSYYSHIQRAVEGRGKCESCMVMIASNRDYNNQYHLLFKESEPEKPIRIIADYSSSSNDINRYERNAYVYSQCAQLRYINENKQLILVFSSRRKIAVDIGRILDEGTQTLTLNYHYRNDNDPNEGCSIGLYKDSVLFFAANQYSYSPPDSDHSGYYWWRMWVYRYPIEGFIPHKITALTKTINSYHNPKQIGGVTNIIFQVSNDINKTDPVE